MKLYNEEHELKLLSALIYDPEKFDEISVALDDFYDARNQKIFQGIIWALQHNKKPDLPLLSDICKLEPKYWVKIEPISAANIQFYVDSVVRFSRLRKLEILGKKIQDQVNSGEDPDEIQESLEIGLTTIETGNVKKLQHIRDLLSDSLTTIENRYNHRGELPGIPTGFEQLDFLTGGLQNAEFIIVGARPSIGKTAFALCMARAAAGAGYPVGFFSLEQSQSSERMLAAESCINIVNMRTGYLQNTDFSRLVNGCTKLSNLDIWFDHHSHKLNDIRSQARRLVRMGVKILFIDYLTLIQYGDTSMRTFERVGEISHSLKWMARELNVPLVVLSQLNREAEGKRPTLAELRMSGEIEQDADMVVFLHRDRKAETFETFVDIAKQRNGPVDEFVVMFEPHFTRFTDMGVA